MEVKKFILDRKNLTSSYIELRQDLIPILKQAKHTRITDWNSPWFYGAIGLSSMAISVFLNNELTQKNEVNEEKITLIKSEKSSVLSANRKSENDFSIKKV